MSTKIIVCSPNSPEKKIVEFDDMTPGSWYKCVDAPHPSYKDAIGIFTNQWDFPTVILLGGEIVNNEMYKFVELKAVTISYEQ